MSSFSDLFLRAISALIGAAILLTCIMFSEISFYIVFMLIMVLSLVEFIRMSQLPLSQSILLGVNAVGIFTVLMLIAAGEAEGRWMLIAIPLSLGSLVNQLFRFSEKPVRELAVFFLGLGYVVLPLSTIGFIAFYEDTFSPLYVVGLFTMIWCQDTGAYFVGSALGKHKLFERVSPNKSWEGAAGGLVMALVGAFAMSQVFTEVMEMWQWLIAGVVITVSGIFGDLVESFLKRTALKKDSGNLIPGHGGFLDRFDSLLFGAPFFLLLLMIFGLR